MKWTTLARHRAGTTFVLIFFVIFAAFCGVLAVKAVAVYEGIDQRATDTHSRLVPLDYLAGVARRADQIQGLSVVQMTDGTTALQARENGVDWLYFCRDGYLYKQDAAKSVATAERLCQAGSLHIRQLDRLIRADYTAPDGSKQTLLLAPRAAGEGNAG